MSAVLVETLAWTGVLIAAVLVLRRPVSRSFGPEAAYALWALPLFRLVLPPVTLPAWMAPASALAPAEAAALGASAPHALLAAPEAVLVPAAEAGAPVAAAPDPGFDLLATLAAVPWGEILLAVWLAGAAVTLWLRFSAYFRLRDELLAEGREVGRAPGALGSLFGKIRLVETPATRAPLALGVLDPVIALPPGFMALHDRAGRDLALAHELAHHRAGDLLVNILVQPLFALHWWNPLGRFGWLALRRDQEAACDARVMARRGAAERAAYAALIARFAAQPGAAHVALTAPMACPVLGEKSIIHRLRSLTMSDLSPRRRWAGRALLGAGLLAIPLTATVSYAASEAAAASAAAPQAPEAPAAPPPPPGAPDAPLPPPPPTPPTAVLIDTRDGTVETLGKGKGETHVTEDVFKDADGKERRVKMVIHTLPGEGGGPDHEAMKRRFEALRSADKAEREAAIAEMRAEMAELRARGVKMHGHMASPRPPMPPAGPRGEPAPLPPMPSVMVMTGCRPGSSEMVETTEGKDGTQKIMICQARIADAARAGMKEARSGLEEARSEIARDTSIPEETREKVLRTLDAQIARIGEKGK